MSSSTIQKISQEINTIIKEFRRGIERDQDRILKKIGDSISNMTSQEGQTIIEDMKRIMSITIEEITKSIAMIDMIDKIEKEVIGGTETATEERIILINVIEDLDHDRQEEILIEITNESVTLLINQ